MKTRGKGDEIAIAGAGMTGAYLYRLLKKEGCEVHLYDRKPTTRCGLKPCAWGTSSGFIELVGQAGLRAEDYILRRLDHVVMDDVRIKAELMVFDKPRLIRDLLGGAEIRTRRLRPGGYERVIDATGVSRAFLPPIEDDIVMGCRQFLIETEEPLENRIKLGGIGYAWCFPISGNFYHVGCGSLLKDPHRILRDLGWLTSSSSGHERKARCGCTATIRLTGPHLSLPFVSEVHGASVWGIGEAIGCVAPLAGDGVVPGMQNVHHLLKAWDSPEKYTHSVLHDFQWMRDERSVIDKLIRSEGLGLREARVLRTNSRRMGMRVGLRDAAALLKNLR